MLMYLTLAAAVTLVSGVMLGSRYKAYVLFPISWAALAMVILASIILGLSVWQSVLAIVCCLTLLQSSYLFGASYSNMASKNPDGGQTRLTAANRMASEI